MDVKLKTVEPFTVAGLQVHTRNADEQQPDTAKIGPMWHQTRSWNKPHRQTTPTAGPGSCRTALR